MNGGVVHVLGARPNFPKAAPVIADLARLGVGQFVVHTGQHYDDRLSRVFFDELGLPEPDLNLGVGSGSHAEQTAAVLVGLERLLLRRRPELVVVYGDVNSTLAAALVAAKLRLPLAHVEAGLRSFDDDMPEEINRRLTDQLADLLFVTSPEAIGHLAREGVPADRIHFTGNPMIDTLLGHLDALDPDRARAAAGLSGLIGLPGDYLVATLHRPATVDAPDSARAVVGLLHRLADRLPVLVPLHPRGRAALEAAGLCLEAGASGGLWVLPPLAYTTFLGLVRGACAVLTDSGGVQEETTVLGVPCLTLRTSTERPVTVTHGTNRLVSLDDVPAAVEALLSRPPGFLPAPRPAPPPDRPPLWDGAAGPRIAAVIASFLAARVAVRQR